MKVEFVSKFSKNTQIPNFMKIRLLGSELFHAVRHDEGNSHFSRICERARTACYVRRACCVQASCVLEIKQECHVRFTGDEARSGSARRKL
jgi:Zn-dependent peptidase ImmA (M78 family)